MTARRDRLLDAADRIVQRDGPAASMEVIAAEAGITKPILYRHFGAKKGLYTALAARHTERLLDVLRSALGSGGTPRDRVALTIDAYLRVIEEEPQVYRFLMHSDSSPHAPVRSFLRTLGDLLAQGISAELGPAAGEVRTAAWAHAVVGMVQGAGDWWLEHRPCPRGELVDELTALLWGAYGQGADSRRAPARPG